MASFGFTMCCQVLSDGQCSLSTTPTDTSESDFGGPGPSSSPCVAVVNVPLETFNNDANLTQRLSTPNRRRRTGTVMRPPHLGDGDFRDLLRCRLGLLLVATGLAGRSDSCSCVVLAHACTGTNRVWNDQDAQTPMHFGRDSLGWIYGLFCRGSSQSRSHGEPKHGRVERRS